MKVIVKWVFLFCVILSMIGCRNRKKEMIGTWIQKKGIATIEGFYKADSIIFQDSTFSWFYMIYLDNNKQQLLAKINTNGTWVCEGRSPIEPTITDYVFFVKDKNIQLMDTTTELMDNYYFRLCNLPLKEVVDISQTGCAVIPPIADQPRIYFAAKVQGNLFYNANYQLHEMPVLPIDRNDKFEQIPLEKIK